MKTNSSKQKRPLPSRLDRAASKARYRALAGKHMRKIFCPPKEVKP